METFNDNVVIITGASSGIGKELALQLARQGAKLALAARHLDALEPVVKACAERGGEAMAVLTDVADKVQCKRLIDKTIERYGRIDTLVNNAGLSMWARFEEITDLSLFEKIMQVNYFGSLYCTWYALPYLKKTRGRLVGVSSLTGKTGVPTRTGYAASKHAMAGFFDSLRVELKQSGVSVTMIYPGFVATAVRERAFGSDGKALGKSHLEEANVMTVEECVQQIIPVISRRKRELVMTTRGKVGMWLKLIAPALVDKIALRSIEKGRT
jgi:short-subunit dehydrogenase